MRTVRRRPARPSSPSLSLSVTRIPSLEPPLSSTSVDRPRRRAPIGRTTGPCASAQTGAIAHSQRARYSSPEHQSRSCRTSRSPASTRARARRPLPAAAAVLGAGSLRQRASERARRSARLDDMGSGSRRGEERADGRSGSGRHHLWGHTSRVPGRRSDDDAVLLMVVGGEFVLRAI